MSSGIALAVALFATRGKWPERSSHAVLSDLARAGNSRLVEPRLSLPLPYAPFRLTGAAERRQSLIRHEAGLLSETVSLALPAEPGLTHLLMGEWDNALDALQRSGHTTSPVDLAAAYYMRGVATDALLDFCRALDALQDAPDSAEGFFNRALILEQLSDFEAAAAAWEQYLAKDQTSAWASEARAHLERTRQPPVAVTWLRDKPELVEAASRGDAPAVRKMAARYPFGARRLVELDLLPSWGEAFSRGDIIEAEHHLRAAERITARRPVAEERLLEQAIREIRWAVSTGTAAPLAAAYADYRRGYDALDVSKNEDALRFFSRALSQAGAEGSALQAIIVPNIVTAHYRRYEYSAAEAWIEKTRVRYRDRAGSYVALFARLDWLSGLIAIARPDASLALQFYRSALAVYERLGEAEYQAAQHVNQADTYFYLGDAARAAIHLRKALTLASQAEDPRRLHAILKLASQISLEEAGPAAAIVFQDRLVRIARAGVDPMRLADALVFRGWVLVRAGKRDEGLHDLVEMLRLAPRIPDEPTRLRLEADASAIDALAHRGQDDHRAIASLTHALEAIQRLEMHALMVQLLMERGRAYLRLGDLAAAERDFESGIDRLEKERVRIDEASLRISYFDRADRIFVDLAALFLSRGHAEDAFQLLERSRSRELLDQASGQPMMPLSLDRIQAGLSDGTVLVTQTVHERGLMTFVVTRDALRAVQTDAGERVLAPLVEQVSSAFDDGNALPQDALRQLGASLIDPIALPAGSRIIFVPDDLLRRVPYGALRTRDGSYLLESHTISVTPSATLLAQSPFRRAAGTPSVLIVASREQPAGFDGLPPLTRTFAESRRVAQSYAGGRVVTMEDGDGATVLSRAREHDILHFAGHTFVDHRTPARSALLFGARGRITVTQIEAADLSNLELVVLAGCNTAMGRRSRSEGALSLARAFLAASVPAVVSTLAPVEDAAAERVLSAFHRGYARGLDAPAALREAQMQMLRSRDPRNAEPVSWSAFQVVQGPAERR